MAAHKFYPKEQALYPYDRTHSIFMILHYIKCKLATFCELKISRA